MGIVARASVRHFRKHPGQLGLAALGIALGVSLAVGIEVSTATVRRAFALSSEAVTGNSTHQVLGGPAGLPEEIYQELRLAPDLPPALLLAPFIEGAAIPESGGGALRILGVDPFAEPAFRPASSHATFLGSGALGAFLCRPGAAVLSTGTAAALRVGVGGTVWLRVGGRRVALAVVAVRTAADDNERRGLDHVALVDISSAQELLAMPGHLSRIDVRINSRIDSMLPPAPQDAAAALAWLAAKLPAGARVVPVAGRAGALAQMTRAFDLNLRALSLLALLVGAFLIYNTMSFSVVQRRSTLAILRTLGATRGQLGRNLLLEALVLGAVGSALGVLLGVLLSRGLIRLIARAVNDLYFAVSVTDDVVLPLGPLARGFVLGVCAALVSAWPAARDATATTPSVAGHRSWIEVRARARTPRLTLGALLLVAVALAVLASSGRSLGLALGALLVLLVGCAGLVPGAVLLAARGSGVVLGALRGATGRLAARSIGAGLSRTGVATAALTLALSVTTGVGVMVASFRSAVEQWLAGTLRADVYVSAPSTVGARADTPLPAGLLNRLRALPGVAQVGSNRIVTVPANGVPTLLMAIDLPEGRDLGVELLRQADASVPDNFRLGTGLLVSEPLAYKRGLAVGARVTLATDRGDQAFPVLGVYRDYGSDMGAIMMGRQAYNQFFDDALVTGIGLHAAPGIAPDDLVTLVRSRLGPEDAVVVRSNQALREASLKIFDRTFEVTSVLRLIALIVAAFGVTSALMALGLERVRELATLRALGATPGQVVELTIVETALLGGLAGVLAIPLGMVLAAVLVFVINQRSFGWTMPLSPSWRTLLSAPALGAAAGVVAGIYPAWRASRVVPAQALREE